MPYFLMIKLAFVLLGAGALLFFYNNWKTKVEEAALWEYKYAQEQQIAKEKQQELDSANERIVIMERINKERNEELERTSQELDNLRDSVLNNNEDRESSKVLKDTFETLRKNRR